MSNRRPQESCRPRAWLIFDVRQMKKRRICVLALACVGVVIAAGIRSSTGQGYSDPIVRPGGGKADSATSQRTLEVQLKNRKTGRPQHYQWSLSVPPSGLVEVECHEWMHVRLFGFQIFGAPRNSFHRTISRDVAEEGIAGPYDYVIRWRTKNA